MKKVYTLQFISLVLVSFSAMAQTSSVWKSKVDPVVLKKAETSATVEYVAVLKQQADLSAADKLESKEQKGQFVYASLKAAAQHSQGEILSLLSKSTATYRSFWVVNIVSVTSDMATLQAVAELASVDQIIENGKYVVSKTFTTPLSIKDQEIQNSPMAGTWGITKTKADQVWSQLKVTGKGAIVAGEDTGYDWEHPAIKSKYRGWNGSTANHNYNWHDAVHATGSSCGADSPEPCDDQKHGTHTMGTMVGGNASGTDIGMAPDAKWMGCRNMNANNGTLTSYVECFEFFLAPTDLNDNNADPSKSPHVINNSWGCPTSEGCNSSNFATMEKVVNNLRAAGVVVVVSAGNDGSACSTINTAAPIFVGSFTVGSTTSGDAASSFSSRGPVTNYGNHLSPDISAPGSDVYSCIPGGGYELMSGTSMAGPHVAGLVALIISANPALAGKVSTIEDIIQSTAVKLTSTQTCGGVSGSTIPNNTFGYGRIDALAAVTKAISLVSVEENGRTSTYVSMYPNPFTNTINVEFKNWEGATTLEIYSITGAVIFSKTWETVPAKYEVDIASQAAGVYFYKISNSKQNATGKLFKVGE
ncbi:MAG TPA: S8/S53 family peptidase [Bacteroidia bacterium]|jgi:subtilisin family serine protease|nr:S8/S53 family peptidase [Bacteroidia bacterium]